MDEDLSRNFSFDKYVNTASIGLWACEQEENTEPRMYADAKMMELLGLEERLSPEETYRWWFNGIDPDHRYIVQEAIGKMIAGEQAEVQYPWLHPSRGKIFIRCGGQRDLSYTGGVRVEGSHQDVTEMIHMQKSMEIENDVFANMLSEIFVSAYYINLVTHEYVIFRRSKILGKKYGAIRDYLESVTKYINNDVAPENREEMLAVVQPDYIRTRLNNEGNFEVVFRDISGTKTRDYKLKIAKGYDENSIVMGFIDISDELRRKNELEKNSRIIQALAGDYSLIYTADLDSFKSSLIYVNSVYDKVLNKLGFNVKKESNMMDFIRRLCKMVVIPEDREYFIETLFGEDLKTRTESRHSTTLEFCVEAGNWRRHLHMKVVPNTAESKHSVIVGVRDIEHEYAERARYERNEELYRKAILAEAYSYYEINLTDDKIIPPAIINVDGVPTDCTSEFGKKLPNYSELVKKSAEQYVDEKYAEDYKKYLSPGYLMECFERGNTMPEFTYRVIAADKSWRYRKCINFLSKDTNSGNILSMNVAYDVTEEVEQHELYEQNVDHIMRLSSNFEAIYDVNLVSGEYIEYTRDNIYAKYISDCFVEHENFFSDIVKNVENVVYKDDRKYVKEYNTAEFMRSKLEEAPYFTYDYRLMIEDRPVWYRIRVVNCSDGDEINRVLIGVFNVNAEVMEQNLKKTQLENALNQAQSANKAKTAFLNSMSHDIRTPMNAIIGYTHLAGSHIDEKERVQDYLFKIGQSSEHLLSLINNVLDVSRIESGKMQLNEKKENLYDVINSIKNMIASEAGDKQQSLSVDMTEIRNASVFCDRLRLSQVLLNILSNAIKYTQTDGKIDFIIKENQNSSNEYGSYTFTVKDNGMGISKDFLDIIFDPFTRVNSTTISGIQGTGLGMAITKSLVEMMGGNIEIDSEPGNGTCVSVKVEMKYCSMTDAGDRHNDGTDPDMLISDVLPGRKVLLVEDNVMNMEISVETLTEAGMLVTTAENGAVALDIMTNASEGDFDLILMDIQMPVMDGYEATRQIRALNSSYAKNIPIIAMTANAFDEDRSKAFEAGMNEHLAKPIYVNKMFDLLKKILKGAPIHF